MSSINYNKKKIALVDCNSFYVSCERLFNPKNSSTVIANVNEELVVKTFVKGKNNNYLASGQNKIELSENPNVIIWGTVTYVIHKL